jgi:hypothetical protein
LEKGTLGQRQRQHPEWAQDSVQVLAFEQQPAYHAELELELELELASELHGRLLFLSTESEQATLSPKRK